MNNLKNPNSKRTKQGALAILIALLMMVSLVANVGAEVLNLAPEYAKPGDTIEILSFKIQAPAEGTTLQDIDIAYTGSDPNDIEWVQVLIDSDIYGTRYGFPIRIDNDYIIDPSDTVTVTLVFKIAETAQHGNLVDGMITAYTLLNPGGPGTDIAGTEGIDPDGYTIIRAVELEITSDPLVLTAGTQGEMTVGIFDMFGVLQPAGAYVVDLASSSSSGKYHFYEADTQNVISSITIAEEVSFVTFDYYDEEAGTPTITVSVADGIILPNEQMQTVNPADLDQLTITGQPSTIVAGTPFPSPLNDIVVTALDEFDNIKTDYTGTMTFTSTDPLAVPPVPYNFVAEGTHTFDGGEFVLKTAGPQTITVTDGTESAITGEIIVNPAQESKLVFTDPIPSSTTAGVEADPFTVQRQDPYGNPVTTGTITVGLSSNSNGANKVFRVSSGGTSVTSVDIGAGMSTASFYYYDEKAGVWTITASAIGLTSAVTDLTVNPADVDHFEVSATSPQTAGTQFPVTITAVDQYGNVKTDYAPAGTYVWTTTASDAPDGTTPAIGELVEGNFENGVAVNPVTLYCAEAEVTFKATDANQITGTSDTITVTPALLASFTIEGAPSTWMAGESFPDFVVVTAYDMFGNVKTDYTGTVSFTSTDSIAELPEPQTLDEGIYSFAGSEFVLYKAGTQTITVADGAISATTGPIDVDHAQMAIFIVKADSVTIPVDVVAGGDIPITAQLADIYGNPVDIAVEVTLSVSDVMGTTGELSTTTAATNLQGWLGSITYTVSTNAGDSARIHVFIVDPLIEGKSAVITTITAEPDKLVFTVAPTSTTAGVEVGPFTVQRLDTYNNPVTAGTTTIDLSSTSGASVTSVDIVDGKSTVNFDYYDEKTGVWTITASATQLNSAETTLTVNPADVDHFDVSAASPQTADIQFDVTITAVDQYGNVKTDYIPTGTYEWTTTANNAPDATLPEIGTLVDGDFVDGVAVKLVTLYCAEMGITFTATDAGVITGTSGPITVDPAEANHLNVHGILDPVTAGTASGVTVEALDAYDNRATGYLGTIQFASSDGSATLPGDYTFTAGDGIKVFTDGVILTTAGEQWVSATDSKITGEQSGIIVNPGHATKLQILVPGETAAPGTATGKTGSPTAQEVGQPFDVVVNAVDEYWNLNTAGLAMVEITTTDSNDIEPAQADLVDGTGTFSVTFLTMGTWTITATDIATDPLLPDTSPQITVNPGHATKLQILVPGETAAPGTATGKTGSPTAQEVGQPFDVVVNAVDEYWNINPAGVATVEITTTDLEGIVPLPEDLDDGIKTFTVEFRTVGGWTITATDIATELTADTSPQINVNPGPATHLDVSGITDEVTAGVDSGVTVEARDEFDNVATGYTGTIQFASSDIGTATILPGDYTFTADDDGIKVFDGVTPEQIVILTTAGEHWVSATDIAYIEYSYSANIDIEGSDFDLVLTVVDDGDWVTWTFDFPVEEFTGDGNLNVGLIIALDGEGEGPAFQIHNNDGATTVEPHGTWMYGYWGPTIDDGWFGWPDHALDVSIAGLAWVDASGNRNVPHGEGIMTISISRAVLGNEFHWAASPTVGSGFWDAYDDAMQVPTAFDWSTPIVDMAVPNYVHRSSIWGQQTDITVETAEPAYVDVIASHAGDEGHSISVLVGDEAMITATVTDAFGNLVPETPVSFETDLGTIWPPTDETENGIAQTSIFSTDVGETDVDAIAGSVSGFCTITFVEQTLEIQLDLGWNLISVPRTLAVPAIEDVFAGITTVEKVYTYDGDWDSAFFEEGALQTDNTLKEIVDGKGYWVYTSEPNMVTIYLKPLGYMETPPSYPLPASWSLIGYTSIQLNPQMSIDNYLGYLPWNTLYRFDTDTRMYEIAKPNLFGFDYTELGRGYWIHLDEGDDLVP